MSLRFTAAAILAVFMLLGLPLLVSAAAPAVVINELMWDGSEYIELYNSTGAEIELSGWVLTRQQAGQAEKVIALLGQGETIAAGTYFLLEKKDESTTVIADKIAAGLTLVNTGELVKLKDSDGAVIDEANWLGRWWAGEDTEVGLAMERTDVIKPGTQADNWHTSTGTGGGRLGTPGAVNSLPKINSPPQAVIDGPSDLLVNKDGQFSAEDSSDADNDELTYAWSFGDGAIASGAAVAHAFTTAGSYTVVLTVADSEAESESIWTVKVSAPVYSKEIVINEFLPNPVGSDTENEFIELKNIGSNSIDISGWNLDDADGGSAKYMISSGVILIGGAVKSFSRSDTKIALNNDQDMVRLLDPAGNIQSSHAYTGAKEGQSYNRLNDGSYVLSTTVTTGQNNVITQPVEDEEADAEDDEKTEKSSARKQTGKVAGAKDKTIELAAVRQEEEGTIVTVAGTVSVPPGMFGQTQMYLSGSGIQVYNSSGSWPVIKLGDQVKLTAALSSNRGEARLKLANSSDLVVVAHGNAPAPHIIETSAVDEDKEGWLVTIQGEVTETSGDTFYLDNGSGEAKVYIKETTGIDKPAMKKGMAVTVTGVVSETTSGYRVLPRFQEDVRLGLVAGLTSFPATGALPVMRTEALLTGIVLAYLLILALAKREPLLIKS